MSKDDKSELNQIMGDYMKKSHYPGELTQVTKPEETIAFPGLVRFILHLSPTSVIEGRAEFKNDGLVGYLSGYNAQTVYELVRQGAKIKAHMYFEIEPDKEKKLCPAIRSLTSL